MIRCNYYLSVMTIAPISSLALIKCIWWRVLISWWPHHAVISFARWQDMVWHVWFFRQIINVLNLILWSHEVYMWKHVPAASTVSIPLTWNGRVSSWDYFTCGIDGSIWIHSLRLKHHFVVMSHSVRFIHLCFIYSVFGWQCSCAPINFTHSHWTVAFSGCLLWMYTCVNWGWWWLLPHALKGRTVR